MYENLPVVCYWCGRLGHADEGCRFSEGELSSDNSDCPLNPENFVAMEGKGGPEPSIPMMVEGKGSAMGSQLQLGPWLVTS